MHEAKAIKFAEMIEDGNADKVKWGEFLDAYTALDLSRMLMAMEKLSPCRIDSLIDVCHRAKHESKKRSFEALKLKMIEMGVSTEDFAEFMDIKPKRKASDGGHGNRIDPSVRREIIDILKVRITENEHYSLAGVRKELASQGYPVTPTNIYGMRDKAVKEIQEEQAAA